MGKEEVIYYSKIAKTLYTSILANQSTSDRKACYFNKKDVEDKMAELLVVRSKIKNFSQGCNVGSDFAEALSKKVEDLIKDAARRAKANSRKLW